MYGIFTNIYPINGPNVGKYTIHGAYGIYQLVQDFATIHSTSWLFPSLCPGGHRIVGAAEPHENPEIHAGFPR